MARSEANYPGISKNDREVECMGGKNLWNSFFGMSKNVVETGSRELGPLVVSLVLCRMQNAVCFWLETTLQVITGSANAEPHIDRCPHGKSTRSTVERPGAQPSVSLGGAGSGVSGRADERRVCCIGTFDRKDEA